MLLIYLLFFSIIHRYNICPFQFPNKKTNLQKEHSNEYVDNS